MGGAAWRLYQTMWVLWATGGTLAFTLGKTEMEHSGRVLGREETGSDFLQYLSGSSVRKHFGVVS